MALGGGGVGSNFTELKDLLVGYARQETRDPLRGLGAFLAWGLIGSVLVGIGGLLLTLAVLRSLQTETGSALDNNLSFVPYLITLLVLAVVIGAVAYGIVRTHKKQSTRKTRSAS